MTAAIIIHADAQSELPFDYLQYDAISVVPSQLRWNGFRTLDLRHEQGITQFFEQANINAKQSGVFAVDKASLEAAVIDHCEQSKWHLVLLPNEGLFDEQHNAWQQAILTLKSGRHAGLKAAGIKSGQLRIQVPNSGTCFAGMSVLQRALNQHIGAQSGKISQQKLAVQIDNMCQKAVNYSIVDLSQVSKQVRKLLKIRSFKASGWAVLKMHQDSLELVDNFAEQSAAIEFMAEFVSRNKFLVPNYQISAMDMSVVNRNGSWQHASQQLEGANITLTQTLPSLAAMVMLGKSVINFGWISLN